MSPSTNYGMTSSKKDTEDLDSFSDSDPEDIDQIEEEVKAL